MLSGDENKPVGKSGTSKKNTRAQGKKAEQRRRKSTQQQESQPVQFQDQPEAIQLHDQAAAVRLQSEPETIGVPPVSIESSLASTALADGSLGDCSPTISAVSEEVDPVASIEDSLAADTALADSSLGDGSPIASVTSEETAPLASIEPSPVSYQTIANAYCSYTLRSFDQTRSFFEQLAAVRSPDQAFQLQTEFARQACDGLVTGAQRIGELHGKLARQRLERWEEFFARMTGPSLNPTHQA